MKPGGAASGSGEPGRVRIGLVGGGKGGSALLDYLQASPAVEVVVAIDRRQGAPALAKARALGIPTASDPLSVFAHPVDVVLEVTGQPAVLDDLLRAKPPGVEVIGARGLRFFWELLEDASEKRQRLMALFEITKRHLFIKDTIQLLPRIAREAAAFLGADGAGIRILENGELILVASYGFSTEEPRERVSVGESGTGWVVQHNQPLAIQDLREDPRMIPEHRAVYQRTGFRSMLAVPLRIADQPIGAIFVFTKDPRHFSPADTDILSGFADHAALAIQNARLFEETERRRQTAESLAEVSRLISRSLDPTEVGRVIADSVRALLDARSSFFFRVEPDSGDLVSVAVSGDVGPLFSPNLVVRRGTGAVTLAVRERQAVATPNILTDPRITLTPEDRRRIEQAGFRAVLAVPLLIEDRVIGALAIGREEGATFHAENIRLAQAFADQAAVALENARLYGELRQALEKLQSSQHQLVQTERLRALGEMAAGVAHDFNNLLAIILGRAEILLSRANDPAVMRGLEAVRKAALDGAQTVRRIQEFTRTRRTRPLGRVALEELLRDLVELTRPRWQDEAQSRGVTYEVRVEGGPVPPVIGIFEELREVFMNLLINALEAMPAGGRLVFRLTADAEEVVVTVEDTGCGMSEETRRRVFEPFFTTKGVRGTGLGLAVAWGIVTRHGGKIEVESALGAGSVFTVRLPRARELPSREAPAAPPLPAAQAARVLVIEDELEVRAVLRDVLVEQGYTVLEAANGAEGLAQCEAEPVDLVLTDLSMPEMSGWEVAAACRARDPQLPIGFITGWGDQLDSDQFERYRINFVLAKPFAASDVLRHVAQALSAARPQGPGNAQA